MKSIKPNLKYTNLKLCDYNDHNTSYGAHLYLYYAFDLLKIPTYLVNEFIFYSLMFMKMDPAGNTYKMTMFGWDKTIIEKNKESLRISVISDDVVYNILQIEFGQPKGIIGKYQKHWVQLP